MRAMADRACAVLCTAMASFLSTIHPSRRVAAVALVLLLGLINMMRGGSPNRSQKLMRLRVLLQFVAIVITMLAVWAMGRALKDHHEGRRSNGRPQSYLHANRR